MRTLKINRVIAILVSVVMLYIMLGANAYASTESPNKFTGKMLKSINIEKIDISEIENAENLMGDAGISICSRTVNDKGEVVYRTDTGGVKSDITIKEANESALTCEIVEGSKKDLLSYDDEGNLTVNGGRVYLIEDFETQQEITMDAVNYYATPPVAGSYTYYSGKTVTHNIELNNKIASYTVSGLAFALSSVVPGLGGAYIGVAGDIISSAIDADGDVIKMKGKIYYHSVKKVFMVTSTQGCHKEALVSYGETGRALNKGKITDAYKYVTMNGA